MLRSGHFDFEDVVGERARRMLGRLTGRWHFHNFGGLVLDWAMASEGGGQQKYLFQGGKKVRRIKRIAILAIAT